jgi:hypothetical protein
MNTRTNGMTFTSKAAQARIQVMLQACKHGRTRQELEIILALTRRTTLSYLIHLHATEQLHISKWVREGIGQFYPVPVYKTGKGIDAAKPEPLNETEKQKRAWAKLKADPMRYAKHRARKARRPVEAAPAADSPFNWRGQPSIITNTSSWRNSVIATANTAGSGTDPRKQFTINRGQP